MADFNSYSPPFFLFNAHLETIYPALLRRVKTIPYTRERINTPDDDFLDLDWLNRGSKKLVIVSHGLEGNSLRPYVRGMAKALFAQGFDVIAWNYRGCGDEINRQLRFYHSGATDDLDVVLTHALKQERYTEIYLVGFSLGGNLTLKYLGERESHPFIKKAIIFSAPIHLSSSCEKISQPSNRIYAQRFLRSLKRKILEKDQIMPGLNTSLLPSIKSIKEFDEAYTAPLHGYASADEYYKRNSSIYFLSHIKVPTLIVNTKNDPFLSPLCFPVEEVKGHSFLTLEMPLRGGHVGFTQINMNGLYWSEQRAIDWFKIYV
jgi:predicted alpha/beta-fold hydrolase